MFKKFSSFLVFWVVLCFQAQACYGSSNQVVKNQISKASTSDGSDNSLKSASDLFPPKIQIKDDAPRAGLLYDLSTDTIFWKKNINRAYPIASLTKMMVGLLVIEDIRAGRISWNSLIRVTCEATRAGGFIVCLRSGRSLSVKDLLKATLISSGNDAAYLLAQFLGGTEQKFVHRMNRRAQQLGMKSTRFSNSTGMPALKSQNDNHSSPSDLLILCKEMLKHDELLHITSMSESSISQGGKIIRLRNHNRLVAIYDEVDGFKTGYTINARYCLAATANKNGRRIIAIALGVKSRNLRTQFVGSILSQSYKAMGAGSLRSKTCSTIASKKKTKGSNSPFPITHRVRTGDTLYSIAKTHGCSIAQLKGWNRLHGNVIKPGQRLKIYKI